MFDWIHSLLFLLFSLIATLADFSPYYLGWFQNFHSMVDHLHKIGFFLLFITILALLLEFSYSSNLYLQLVGIKKRNLQEISGLTREKNHAIDRL